MLINYNLLIKFFISILIICFSAYFFYLGYVSLNLYKSNSITLLNSKTNIIVKKNKNISKSNDTGIFYQSKKNEIIVENQIIIKIKKNDDSQRKTLQTKNIKFGKSEH